MHSTVNLPPSTILKKNSTFFEKPETLCVFEKSYSFIRILRKFCHNLVIKNFQSQNRPGISRKLDIFN